MKWRNLVYFSIALLLTVRCVTPVSPYRLVEWPGDDNGVSEKERNDLYRFETGEYSKYPPIYTIKARGNCSTDSATLTSYITRRALELCNARGYTEFRLFGTGVHAIPEQKTIYAIDHEVGLHMPSLFRTNTCYTPMVQYTGRMEPYCPGGEMGGCSTVSMCKEQGYMAEQQTIVCGKDPVQP